MEKLVLSLCGLWFWLTRKYRVAQYRQAAEALNAAYESLAEDLYSRWSTRDRGYILPFQAEALAILKRHSTWTVDTASRFESLLECCRFVTEELAPERRMTETQRTPLLQPALLPAAANRAGTFRFFWNAEDSGRTPRPFPLLPFKLKATIAEAEVPPSRAA